MDGELKGPKDVTSSERICDSRSDNICSDTSRYAKTCKQTDNCKPSHEQWEHEEVREREQH